MRKVILAIDGSTASHQAAAFLAHLPHSERLDLTVVSVVQRPFIHGSYASGDLMEKAYQRDKAFAMENYEQIAEMFEGANVTLRHAVMQGNVGDAIVETAKMEGAELIVVGATGRSQISRVLLGSVSDHVATHAHCSVLVIRPTGLEQADRTIRVCLAYDANDPARAALAEVAEIPWRTGTDFHVLTVVSNLYDYFGEVPSESDTAKWCSDDLEHAKEKLREVAPQTKTHLVESEHIGEGIIKFSLGHEMDLMVIGETPRTALGRFVTGSTTRYVLRHAACSVWITRNRATKDAESRLLDQATVT